MSALPRIFGGGRRGGIAAVVALAAGQAGAAGVAAFATRDVFAALAIGSGEPMPTAALLLIVAGGIAIAALRVGERAIGESVGQSYAAALRRRLFRHLMHLPVRVLARRRAGGLALRFVADLAAVRGWVSLGVARLISAAIVLPAALATLVLLSPGLAVAAGIPLAVAVIVMAVIAPRMKPLHKTLRRRRAALAADISERIPVAPELRLLGRVRREGRYLAKRSLGLRRAAVMRARAAATLRAIPDAGIAVAGGAVLWTALTLGAATGEAAAALAMLAIVAVPLRDLATIADRHRAWEVARDKCQGILDLPVLAAVEGDQGPGITEALAAELRFSGAGAGALRQVTAHAAPGAKIAVTGGNGAGKSTLLQLAAGLERLTTGAVTLDGTDIAALSDGERRGAIAYVGPHSPIIKGSLRRALTLGVVPRPDDAAVTAAACGLGLGDVMARLGGLDGRIAAGGRNLSSGEARRVLLTRAALARPRLLLLDEPDDALDENGRECVAELLRSVAATVLVVTHDQRLAAEADAVWIVQNGEVHVRGPDDRGRAAAA